MNGPDAEKALSIINLFILIGFAVLRSSGQSWVAQRAVGGVWFV